MRDPEMQELEGHHPLGFVGSAARRLSIPRSSVAAASHRARPSSSIYSRSINYRAGGPQSASAGEEDRDYTRLLGWIHPALRPRTASSVLTTMSAMLGRSASQDDLEQQQRNPRRVVGGNGQGAGIAGDNNGDATGPASPPPAAPKQGRRRCGPSFIGWCLIATIALGVVAICICFGVGAFGTKQRVSPSSAHEQTSLTPNTGPSSLYDRRSSTLFSQHSSTTDGDSPSRSQPSSVTSQRFLLPPVPPPSTSPSSSSRVLSETENVEVIKTITSVRAIMTVTLQDHSQPPKTASPAPTSNNSGEQRLLPPLRPTAAITVTERPAGSTSTPTPGQTKSHRKTRWLVWGPG